MSEVKFMLCPHDDSWKGIKGHDYPVQVALKLRYPKVCFFLWEHPRPVLGCCS